ncbi:hypothetical protein QQS21_004874 [Conoideocrella luteorostrata]|uniref:Nucleoside phosphorylase domain-containing protein n=1 Tax=Conoideocrella luteorostrata TaxID=1105319 RepID=A0AAJ0CQM7_9HYPO|nr:hypothetical protein QQS21_004874 [Conoideocrella luteorostrata]
MSGRPATRNDFEIAIICALALESNAVSYVFDELWDDHTHTITRDPNFYIHGRIGKHNVVLALLPGIGKIHAAAGAAALKANYRNIRLALLTGICGAVPRSGRTGSEIFLGDIVIGDSIIQFDFGRKYPDRFRPKKSGADNLGSQSRSLRSVFRALEMDQLRQRLEHMTSRYLQELKEDYIKKNQSHHCRRYEYPGGRQDHLFEAQYRHRHRGTKTCCDDTHTCDMALQASCHDVGCDEAVLVSREFPDKKRRLQQDVTSNVKHPVIHIGAIASGDIVMRSGEDRDEIAQTEGIIAFEMEGAGIKAEIPCLIVKGVSDYADSHKEKMWQDFAAAAAAAAAKALLDILACSQHAAGGGGMAAPHQAYSSIPPQIPLQVVMVIDARGCHLPFHLETINSKQLFIELLKSRFKDLGTRKIERGEWILEDQATGKRLDFCNPWETLIRQKRNVHRATPSTKVAQTSEYSGTFYVLNLNPGHSTLKVSCSSICGIIFQRVEELETVHVNRRSPETTREPTLTCKRRPEHHNAEEDIGRYRHVEIVNVNLVVKTSDDDDDDSSTKHNVLLSLSGTLDQESIAISIAKLCGLSKKDCLQAADEAIAAVTTTPTSNFTCMTPSTQHEQFQAHSALQTQDPDDDVSLMRALDPSLTLSPSPPPDDNVSLMRPLHPRLNLSPSPPPDITLPQVSCTPTIIDGYFPANGSKFRPSLGDSVLVAYLKNKRRPGILSLSRI